VVLITFLAYFTLAICCSWQIENGWNQFLPLKSTRVEIEAYLSKLDPNLTIETADERVEEVKMRYQTRTVLMHVTYLKTPCIMENAAGEKQSLPAKTVLGYDIVPNNNLTVSGIKWDKSDFDREKDFHVARFVHYRHREKGISMETREMEDGTEVVRNVRYFPTNFQKEKLVCS